MVLQACLPPFLNQPPVDQDLKSYYCLKPMGENKNWIGFSGDGIRTREHLRDRALNPAPLTWLGNPCSRLFMQAPLRSQSPFGRGPAACPREILYVQRFCRLWLKVAICNRYHVPSSGSPVTGLALFWPSRPPSSNYPASAGNILSHFALHS